MPIRFQCPQCARKLKVGDEASGKIVDCPGCGMRLKVPMPALEAELVEPEVDQNLIVEDMPSRSRGRGRDEDNEGRKPCPMCGEMIAQTALKCRFCGEIFDPALKEAEARKKKKKRRHSSSSSSSYEDDEMSVGDWIVAVICPVIGCIAGIVWLIQGKSKGGTMLVTSLIVFGISTAVRAMLQVAQP